MRKKKPIPSSQKFPNADPLALRLLERMLAFEPKDRPTAEVQWPYSFSLFALYMCAPSIRAIVCPEVQALADPYFRGLAKVEREPSAQPVMKMEFEFEWRRMTKEDVRELIYREILEYYPQMLKGYLEETDSMGFMYPRPCVLYSDNTTQNSAEVTEDFSKCCIKEVEKPQQDRSCRISMSRIPIQVPQRAQGGTVKPGKVVGSVLRYNNCGTAAAEVFQQRRMISDPALQPQYITPSYSYPRRNTNCKSEKGDDKGI